MSKINCRFRRERSCPRTFLAVTWIGVASAWLSAGCSASGKIQVSSQPPGARILLDGEDSGLKTPATLVVSTERSQITVRLEKPGYNPVSRVVEYTTEVDPITPSEAVETVVCSPCCLGLPLLRFLEPVKVRSQFVPSKIDAYLDPAGQGIDLEVSPANAQVLVDGALVTPLTRNLYSLDLGAREIEVRAEGFRTFAQRVQVREGVYHELTVLLQPDGAGIIVHQPRRVFAPRGEVRIVVDGALESSSFGKPIRLEPGEHTIEVLVEGFEKWASVVRVAEEDFLEIRPPLTRTSGKKRRSASSEESTPARDL